MKPDNGGPTPARTFPLGILLDPVPAEAERVKEALTPGPVPIFVPKTVAVAQSQMTDFICFARRPPAGASPTQPPFTAFSVQETRLFWRLFLEWSQMEVEGAYEPVCREIAAKRRCSSPNLHLSFVQISWDLAPPKSATALKVGRGKPRNLRAAVTACNERGERVVWSREELTQRVLLLATALRRRGLQPGDRVVAVASNTAGDAPGLPGHPGGGRRVVRHRPRHRRPSAHRALRAAGAQLALLSCKLHAPRLRAPHPRQSRGAPRAVPSMATAVRLRGGEEGESRCGPCSRKVPPPMPRYRPSRPGGSPEVPIQSPALYPLFVRHHRAAKCIVHGAGGTLIEHVKEHRLHGDLQPATPCTSTPPAGGMMYNWQLVRPGQRRAYRHLRRLGILPRGRRAVQLVERERITVFGTSPGYRAVVN